MVTELQDNEIFVFGSNTAGRHGRGAAKQAVHWGAKYGQGFGRAGQTFAVPTKDSNIQTLPLKTIQLYIDLFFDYVTLHPELTFLLTKIGCGLAGYKWKDIRILMPVTLPENVVLV